MNHHATVDTADRTITHQEIIRPALYTTDLLLEDTISPGTQLLSINNIEGKERGTTTIVTFISDDITIHHTTNSTFELTGTIATSGGQDVPISGSTKVLDGLHHWADADGDNTISDKEILIIYDKYSGIQSLENEIDLIEEIWLGDGYHWNTESLQYDIIQ